MTRLAEFLEKVCAGGDPVRPELHAYRMDGTSSGANMRASAGLGTCNCCDYFTLSSGTVVLIEETRLVAQIRDIKKTLAHLQEGERNGRLVRSLKHENRLKVYGSLLVLCRLARELEDKEEAAAVSGIADFWLAFSDDMTHDDARGIDHFRAELMGDLRSVLTPAVVKDVRIVPTGKIGTMLPPHPLPG